MRKSLPLLVGAIVIPLMAATVAAFAATSDGGTTPAVTLTTGSEAPSVALTPTQEAPVQLATTPQRTAQVQLDAPPVVQANDEAESPTTSSTTSQGVPSTPVAPNDWATPEPTTEAPLTPIAPPGPIELTISWDGLKCARHDAWILEHWSGKKMMCPGSATP